MSLFKPYRFYEKAEIEASANRILKLMQETRNRALKWPLDASLIAELLGLDVVWDSIPPDEQGSIAARILPLNKLIEINTDIPKLRGEFGESTIAHEIGHWVLHINPEEVNKCLEQLEQGIPTNVEPFLCRSVSTGLGIEWQAQYFASCLLMPEYKLKEAQNGRDLTNWKHLYAIQDELGVTISNLTSRLKSLNWIILYPSSKQIYPGKSTPSRRKQEFG